MVNNTMRRGLRHLLLQARKAGAERRADVYSTCRPSSQLIGHQQHDTPPSFIHSFIFTRSCYGLASPFASGSLAHPDSPVASTSSSVSSSTFQSSKAHYVKLSSTDKGSVIDSHCGHPGEMGAGTARSEEYSSKESSRGLTTQALSDPETRKLLKLIKMDDFKKRMYSSGKHCMPIEEAMDLCKQTGTAASDAEAQEIVRSLDEAGTVLIFRRKVFLQPEKVAEALSRAMPLPLAQEDDPRKEEYLRMLKEKEEIDCIAHKQVRHMLWAALGALSAQSVIFFRLTFWELSWDVMEPIAFFVTSSSLLAGFFFFVLTHRDPSYHDFMDTLFLSKQRKLMKKRNFDMERFKELKAMWCLPSTNEGSHV